MRVELSADLFEDTDDIDVINSINELFRCFVKERHDLVVDVDTSVTAERFFDIHLPKQAGSYGKVARKASVSGAWSGTRQRGNTQRLCRTDVIDLVEDLCRRSARLVVENGTSDRQFVIAIAKVFGKEEITNAIRNQWLEFVQAGGSGEIHKVAMAEVAAFRRLPRVVAVYDSDRYLPRERSKHEPHAEQLRDAQVTVHVLLLREIENYVPHRVIEGMGDRARTILRHLRALSPEQRGYFDMKNGFKKNAERDTGIRKEQASLYAALDQQVRDALHHGFGDRTLLEQMSRCCGELRESDFDHLGTDAVADLRAMLDAIASQI